jgi:hypothetical protein
MSEPRTMPAATKGGEQLSFAARRHAEQMAELEELAARRFWRLVPEDHTLGRFNIVDQLGRPLYGPAHFTSLRGYFAGLPPQA